ncbi:toll/interleukin-1 receptor domain-containing protein [Vibrio parahaemolyticus]|uniref:toll/interleukin-1 receptor domain-containing protein n=1 Tax=Vibrio parahaemolyticus TaxID=670 RepID=UPI00038E2063|nr:toll/interleukin-1 receptor domain-containing protein [Vibrio parahaemolyticus]EGQ8495344.1 TIR domain-containing protein [Vibrio alginolyticus]ANQ57186.1 toll-Interleukin receptor [Vibrio parahaemolyticus]EGQ8684050.1 TIR domain-containing protein [Vibrio parahaemolyticus]EGQ8781659.1 TIR domain-containing protein [Vibrio parahaemolyticus]EGQ8830594.1 TIR domain-containing protein [Vibrio parahaemolyticus]
MAYFTKSEARNASARVRGYRSAKSFLSESVKKYKQSESFDVFLSHSIEDYDLVLGVMVLLEQQGLKVYVDWVVDEQLDRSYVSKDTAEVLRYRMKSSASLMYIATENSSNSKWMPWELGYFDGLKSDKVAILPLQDSENQRFEGQEYLGLYPLVTKYLQNGRVNHYVEEHGSRWSSLGNFTRASSNIWNKY